MFKKIWAVIQLIIAAVFAAVLFLVTKRKVTTFALDKVQKEAEREAKEKYEKMSDDDVVDSLDNANDIRNTDGIPEGTIKARTTLRNRSKSLLSRLGSKGVRGEDVPGSGQSGDSSISTGKD